MSTEKKVKHFKDYEAQIKEALEKKIADGSLGINERVTIVEGFFMLSFQSQLEGIHIGGQSVPAIVLVGQKSGRIYHFALKVIVPEIEF